MALQDEMVRQGTWLFRYRSYLPLLLFAVVFPVAATAPHPPSTLRAERGWEVFCLATSLFGLAIRAYVAGTTPRGTSGRNTRRQAAETLNTTGLYSVMRHPLYLGNFFIWIGVAMLPRLWWLACLVALVFWLYYERIMAAEEAFLRSRFGEAFEEWAVRTPAFVPALRQWKPAALPFCARAVLRREYSGLFGVLVALAAVDSLGDGRADGRSGPDELWMYLCGAGLILYVVLRILKRRTRLLAVAGR